MMMANGAVASTPRRSLAYRRAISLRAIIPSCILDVDATLARSYPGTGTALKNAAFLPADGAAMADFDFTITGATFNGNAGDPGAYFGMDDTDWLRFTGANPTSIANMGKRTGGANSQAHSIIICYRFINDGAAQSIWSTKGFGATRGINLFTGAAGVLSYAQRGDSATVTATDATLVTATDYFIGIRKNETSTDFFVNSATPSNVAHTFNDTTTDPAGRMTIGALSDDTVTMAANSRLYGFYAFNAAITNAQMALALAQLRFRHKRGYA